MTRAVAQPMPPWAVRSFSNSWQRCARWSSSFLLGFMVGGHLCCGVTSSGLTIRVGPDGKAEALSQPHARPHEIGGRETAAFVVVEPDGYGTDALRSWIERGLCFVATLPKP